MLWSFLLYRRSNFQDFTWSTPSKKQRPKSSSLSFCSFLSFIQQAEKKKHVERRAFASIASNLKIVIQVETLFFLRKDPFKWEEIAKTAWYIHKVVAICSVENFFAKNACTNFSTPYTAHPPTRSETKVTQRVGSERKRNLKKCLTLSRCGVRYAPLTTSN